MKKKSKKKNIVILICLVSSILVLFGGWMILYSVIYGAVSLLYYYDAQSTHLYDDLNLYMNDEYKNFGSGDYKKACRLGSKYIIKYDDFEYNEYVKEFYILDRTDNLFDGPVSFVLELQFEYIDVYNEFLEYEYQRFNYDFEFEIIKNDYKCFLVNDEEITHYYYGKDTPNRFGMLCENIEEKIVRYFFYSDYDEVDESFNYAFENTNCEW